MSFLRGRFTRLVALSVAVAVGLCLFMLAQAMRDPVVRRATLAMPDWPAGALPVRIALLTDIHVAGPDMPPSRVERIVDQVNRLKPDLVLLAGDFVSDKRVATRRYSAEAAVAPLSGLKAPMGVIAVLGNHDHWRNRQRIADALRAAHVRVLDNEAVTVGPLRVGGLDDPFTGHSNIGKTLGVMRAGPGAKLMLSHSPDVAPALPSDVSLLLAGHTHCGQIRLPFVGPVSTMSNYGDRYACGVMQEGKLRVITSAGLGTSLLPFRLGALPDIWLIQLHGRTGKRRLLH